MKLLLKYLLCLLTGTLLFSCQRNNPQEKLLTQAQNSLIMDKPDEALNLLASIQNPNRMDKNSYMQYLVSYVGAKKETKADISSDTLIFEAQRYFNDNGDSKNSALANYYAGWVYYTNNKLPQSLESFMNGADAADKSRNYLLAGKNFNNIAYIYFEQDLFDSAVVNYKRAFPYYDKLENTNQRKIEIFTDIGLTYESDNKLDSAYVYFHRGLDLAKQTGHKLEERQLYHNLGLTCYGMKEYDKAIEYFQSALAMDSSSDAEITQINLYLLNIYNKKQNLKFAKQYADLVVTGLPKVTYKYTLKEIYSSLTDYFVQIGDYKQAFEYSKLEKLTKEQIEHETNAPALLEADKNFYLGQKDREAEAFRSDVFFIFIIGASAFCILFVFFLFVWRRHKKDQAEIQFYGDKYEIMRQALYAHIDEYPKIEAEIKSMLEDD